MRILLAGSILLTSLPSSARVRVSPPSLPRSAAAHAAPPGLLPAARLAPLSLSAPAPAPISLDPAAAGAELAARLRGSEVILIQALARPDGRRMGGHDVEERVKEIITRRGEGQLRSLQGDGPANIFADTFAVEVRPEHKAEVLAELAAIEGADVRSLSRLIELGSRRVVTQTLPDAETLKAYAAHLEDGPIEQRWQAFGELASLLENATPEQLAALPEDLRDELVWPLYGIAEDTVNAFNMVQGSQRTALRRSFLDAKANQNGWGAVESGAAEGLKHPELRARVTPLRDNLTRMLSALDRLGTAKARYMVRQTLPHAEHAGLEFLSAPARAAAYADEFVSDLAAAFAEWKEGLQAPEPDREAERDRSAPQWMGSSRSGGYEHVAGRRQSSHLYFWKPYRMSPEDARNDALMLLGTAAGTPLVGRLHRLLADFEAAWPELVELHKRKELAREYARVEGNLAYYQKQAAEAGRPYTEEQVAEIREGMRRQVVADYDEHRAVQGNSVMDKLLQSFSFYDGFAAIPGFDAGRYAANATRFFLGAAEQVQSHDLFAQLADGALHFLTQLAASDLINTRPELRADAVAAWRALAAKADSLGVELNTRLDGVIDPRPTLNLEPTRLESTGQDDTVYQVATSPNGNYIAQASGDRRIRVWDARSHEIITTIELDDARQLYGDLANSLGVTWHRGILLVTTLHDDKETNRAYNLIRRFDPHLRKKQTSADARGESRVDDAFVLRQRADGPRGPFYASPREIRTDRAYVNDEVRLIAADGAELARLDNAQLLDMRDGRLLTNTHGRNTPALSLWDLTDPANPVDATPEWLKTMVAAWNTRHPKTDYWAPAIDAKLAAYKGAPVLLWSDAGKLRIIDLATGSVIRVLDIPSDWRLTNYKTNASGTRLVALATAPGRFAGPNPERILAWDLTTGSLVMDHDTTYVPTGWLYTRGSSIAQLEFSGERRLVAAGRKGVLVFELP
ncbi:MAG: hypothetical protein SF051_01525 [Elusimicrobiota bacterium]|nr:hypothetical protein [Elusimicrobiota bacterium]